MKTRLTILCENSVGTPFGVVGEHGFACLVETGSGAYLFDTGQGMGIVPNALALRKDLSEVDAVLISHGHYDHTGGLPAVLKLRGPVDVRAHPGIFARRVWTNGEERRDVGIPYRRSYLESLGARFRLETGWAEAGPGVFLTGEVPRETPFEGGDPHMALVSPDGSTRPDPLLDDLSMVVAADSGLVLVLGCAHAGMVNILRHVRRRFPDTPVHAVVGGTHLGFSGEEPFEEALSEIDALGIPKVGVSHCTGLEKACELRRRLGDRFFFGTVGTVLEA